MDTLFTIFAIFIVKVSYAVSLYCRDTWINRLEPDDFAQLTCAKCYVQIFREDIAKGLTITPDQYQTWPPAPPYLLYHIQNPNITFLPDALHYQSSVCEAFLSDEECRQWRQCCQAAVTCCDIMQDGHAVKKGSHFCPATWDGILCWSTTSGHVTVSQSCPHYYVTPSVSWINPHASRRCSENGSWTTDLVHGMEMTNYHDCYDTSKNVEILTIGLYMDFIGYSISILSLLIAVCLLFCTRSLRRDLASRDSLKLHVNLFVSVIGTGATTIPFHYVYYDAVIKANEQDNSEQAIYLSNPVWCRILNILTKYFRSATYMCMFCEGLFLYRRISRMMYVNLRDPLKKYMIVSWGCPVLICVAYIITRIASDIDTNCWIDDGFEYIEYIYIVPNILTLLCNLVFLVSIEYSLCTKMRTDSSDRRVQVLRHALRATLSLIPVFGVQFLFIIYRPPYWPPYEIITSVFNSTQGLLVAVLYCFSTNEFRTEVVLFYRQCRGHNQHYLRRGSTNPNLSTPLQQEDTSIQPARGRFINLLKLPRAKSHPCNEITDPSCWRYSRGSLPDLVLREDSLGRKFSKASQWTGTTVCSLDSSCSDSSFVHTPLALDYLTSDQPETGSEGTSPRTQEPEHRTRGHSSSSLPFSTLKPYSDSIKNRSYLEEDDRRTNNDVDGSHILQGKRKNKIRFSNVGIVHETFIPPMEAWDEVLDTTLTYGPQREVSQNVLSPHKENSAMITDVYNTGDVSRDTELITHL